MNKKILKLIPATLVPLGIFAGCSNNQQTQAPIKDYYGDTEDDDSIETEEKLTDKIDIKYTNFTDSKTVSGTELKTSWIYDHSFNPTQQSILEQVLMGVREYEQCIDFSEEISEDDFQAVMIALLTNYPEVIHIDFTYSYDKSLNGNVRNLYPQYILDNQTYKTKIKTFEQDRINFVNANKSASEYTVVGEAIGKIRNYNYKEIEKTENEGYTGYYSQYLGTSNLHSLGAAKTIKYYLDYIGVSNIVVLGEYIDETTDLYNIYPKDNIKKYVNDLGQTTVTLNLNNYTAWNMVYIGGTWVNVDAYLNAYYQNKANNDQSVLLFNTDEVFRQTRLFYPTYELIGSVPSCSNINFCYFYRHNYYIVNYTDDQILQAIDYWIEQSYYNNHNTEANFQFETEANFNLFSSLIEERIKLFNSTHDDAIPSYEIKYNDKLLTIYIYNIMYK